MAIFYGNRAPATSCPPDALHAAAQRCLRTVRAMLEADVILLIANLTLTMSNMKKLSQRGRPPRSSRASQSPGLTRTLGAHEQAPTGLRAVPLCQGRPGASRFIARLQHDIGSYPLRDGSTPSIISPCAWQPDALVSLSLDREREKDPPSTYRSDQATLVHRPRPCTTTSSCLRYSCLRAFLGLSVLLFPILPSSLSIFLLCLSYCRSGEVDLLSRLIS